MNFWEQRQKRKKQLLNKKKREEKKDDSEKRHISPKLCFKVIELVSEGITLKEACEAHDLPYAQTLLQMRHTYKKEWENALAARAHIRLDKIDELTDRMLDGHVKTDAFRELKDHTRWLAEREDREQYGSKQNIDIGITYEAALDQLPEPTQQIEAKEYAVIGSTDKKTQSTQ